MEKIKLLLFGLSLWLVGNNQLHAQSALPVSGESNSNSTFLVVHSSPNSDYITLELLGNKNVQSFQIFGMDGKEVYQGRISGTQLIEVSTWNVGTYYVICGGQRERMQVSR